jgi:hypothetical protein
MRPQAQLPPNKTGALVALFSASAIDDQLIIQYRNDHALAQTTKSIRNGRQRDDQLRMLIKLMVVSFDSNCMFDYDIDRPRNQGAIFQIPPSQWLIQRQRLPRKQCSVILLETVSRTGLLP